MTSTRGAAPAVPSWRNRIVESMDVPPGDLVPNPANWRRHPSEQRAALSGALDEVGWVAQVIVNRNTDTFLFAASARTRKPLKSR